MWPNFGPIPVKLRPSSAQVWATPCQFWPPSAELRPKVVEVNPNLVKFGRLQAPNVIVPNLADFNGGSVPIRPEFDRPCPLSAQFRPNSDRLRPNRGNFDRSWRDSRETPGLRSESLRGPRSGMHETGVSIQSASHICERGHHDFPEERTRGHATSIVLLASPSRLGPFASALDIVPRRGGSLSTDPGPEQFASVALATLRMREHARNLLRQDATLGGSLRYTRRRNGLPAARLLAMLPFGDKLCLGNASVTPWTSAGNPVFGLEGFEECYRSRFRARSQWDRASGRWRRSATRRAWWPHCWLFLSMHGFQARTHTISQFARSGTSMRSRCRPHVCHTNRGRADAVSGATPAPRAGQGNTKLWSRNQASMEL